VLLKLLLGFEFGSADCALVGLFRFMFFRHLNLLKPDYPGYLPSPKALRTLQRGAKSEPAPLMGAFGRRGAHIRRAGQKQRCFVLSASHGNQILS
jgi:hypothetical protein